MHIYYRICIEHYTITDDAGQSFTLMRGREYTTSATRPDGTLLVFSTYWVRVPARIFAGEIPKESHETAHVP